MMPKIVKIKRATQLTLFSTALLTAVILLLYLMLLSDINADIYRSGLSDYAYNFISPRLFLLAGITALLAYVISAVIIDKTLSPMRLMIAKINETANMDFSKPLIIYEEDEELMEYASAFNDMVYKLNGYIERQKRFISDASHELATPITVINGHADLLLRRGQQHPEFIAGGLEIIKSEVLRMDGLVESLLLLARSDSGKQVYRLERVDIGHLLGTCLKEAEIIAPDITFECIIKEAAAVKCDEYAIQRVLRIVLSNAIKYAAGSIQIRLDSSHGLAQISVKDNGIGISSEHLERIFERFYRVDTSRSNKTGSSGLGLAIAKEIVDAHGGEIKAHSQPGEGTEFCITLPV